MFFSYIKNIITKFQEKLNLDVNLINFQKLPYEKMLDTRTWRNKEEVTKYFKIKYIDEETHEKWLNSLRGENPKCIAFLIKYKNIDCGVTYIHSINYKNRIADWGIYIHETNLRNKHIGKKALAKCIQYAKYKLKLKELYLDVKRDNLIAVKLYKNFNFKKYSNQEQDFVRYKKIL